MVKLYKKEPKLITHSQQSHLRVGRRRRGKAVFSCIRLSWNASLVLWKRSGVLYTREEENQMVRGKKKTKICEKGSEEDWISKLPDPLICEILFHLPTKDSVRTSVLSTRWRNLWHWVPGLDLDYWTFSNSTAFESFVQRFCDSHKDSWIRKLCLRISEAEPFLTPVIDAVTTRMIQHMDVRSYGLDIPLSIYTCETLVHLRLHRGTLPSAEFVFLPCLKIIHLERISYPNEATLEKLISGSPVLEDLTMFNSRDDEKVIRLCSQTVKRIHIDEFTVVIDAPLLQCLKTEINEAKNFEIIHSGFLVKLEIYGHYDDTSDSLICDTLTDISRARKLVIRDALWKGIFRYLKSEPVHQFHDLSCLKAWFCKSNIEMLPTILESCPNLASLIMELRKDPFMRGKKKKEPQVVFSTSPRCLVSSLKIVQYKRLISRYEGEMELVRYFLKNSRVLEKFKLDIYDTEKTKCAVLQELVAIPRCSSGVEVNVSFGNKVSY